MMRFSKAIMFGTKNLLPKQILLKRTLMTKLKDGVYSFEPDLPSQSSDSETIEEKTVTDGLSTVYYERPTPVIFVSGECLTAKM